MAVLPLSPSAVFGFGPTAPRAANLYLEPCAGLPSWPSGDAGEEDESTALEEEEDVWESNEKEEEGAEELSGVEEEVADEDARS